MESARVGQESGSSVKVRAAEGSRLPHGCRVDQVRSLLLTFVSAANSDDGVLLRRQVSPRPELRGVQIATGQPPNLRIARLTTRSEIANYFLRRAHVGVRMRLLYATVDNLPSAPTRGPYRRPTSGPAADDPIASFTLGVELARPGHPARQMEGKGGINCANRQVYMMATQIR